MGNQEELQNGTKKYLKLEAGETECGKCDGYGLIEEKRFRSPLTDGLSKFIEGACYIQKVQCPTCKGEGKLDWVENVVGKKPRSPYGSTFKYDKKTGRVVRVD